MCRARGVIPAGYSQGRPARPQHTKRRRVLGRVRGAVEQRENASGDMAGAIVVFRFSQPVQPA